jgi:hypothetical protein
VSGSCHIYVQVTDAVLSLAPNDNHQHAGPGPLNQVRKAKGVHWCDGDHSGSANKSCRACMRVLHTLRNLQFPMTHLPLHLSVRDRCPTGLRSSRCNWYSSEREWVESTQHKSCNEGDGKKLLWVQQCGNPGNPQIISLNSLTNNHERYYTFNRKLCGIIRIGIIFLSLFQPEL